MAALTAYVRKTGSDNNGGSSASTTPDKNGTDGVTNGTTTFTSASAQFTAGDVDKLIQINTKNRYRIVGYTNSTTITLSGSPSAGSGLTWAIGGAVQTVGAALASIHSSALLGGDTVWIGPGTYRETVTVTPSGSSEIQVNGDVTGSHTGDTPGPVILTAYTTNDKTSPSASNVIQINAKNYYTFQNLVFVGGGGTTLATAGGYSRHITVRDCAFFNGSTADKTSIGMTCTFGNALNWLIDGCLFAGGPNASMVSITLNSGSGADYDADVQIQNCLFLGPSTAVNIAGGASANKGGGVDLRNCTKFGGGALMITTAAQLSTSIPCTVTNSVSYAANPAVSAGTSGQITEDYNIFYGTTVRTNVTAGAHSISDGSYAPLFHFGQERVWGGLLRQLGEPMPGSPWLGFGNDGTQTSTDHRGTGHIRPAGGASASPGVGALERSNTWAKNTGTVRTGSNSISITGPGYQEFLVPVDATSTTISVYVRWDATYAGTKPQLMIDANGEIGVSAETKTATGSSGSWEQLTLSAFTPTAKGIVMLRVISNDTNGGGQVFVDDFAVV